MHHSHWLLDGFCPPSAGWCLIHLDIFETNTLKLIAVLRKTDGKSCFHPSVKVHIFVTDAFELKLELGAIIDENQLNLFVFKKMDDESGFSLSPK